MSVVGLLVIRPMSQMGQTQTSPSRFSMSGLPPIADIVSLHAQVRSVPIADMLYALARRIDGEGMLSEAMPMV
jgi:hypothetical protein